MRDVKGDPVGFLSLPQPLEVGGDLRQISLGGIPGEVDGEDFVVLAPGGLRLVDAACEGDAIPLRIGEDAGFGVIVVLRLVRRDRRAVGVARQHHPDFECALGHHPGHHLQPLAQESILGIREAFQQPCRDAFLQVVTLADRLDVPFFEGGADQQPHAAAVLYQARDAGCRDRQRAGAEEARAAVVAHAGRQRGDVEVGQRVVGWAVVDAEGMVTQVHDGLRVIMGRTARKRSYHTASPLFNHQRRHHLPALLPAPSAHIPARLSPLPPAGPAHRRTPAAGSPAPPPRAGRTSL
ncbi:MAG: hypothetical protein BWY52_01451 [Chloroflexi bacterium ADurb.Bin325]|nr:MAG: hypothetical protein BWY52_01451 [Chloroflexi bacterium ADurb.Bin325]